MSWSNGKLLAGKDEAPVGLRGAPGRWEPQLSNKPKAWISCGHSRAVIQQASLDFRVPIMLFTHCFSNKFSSLPNKVTQYSKRSKRFKLRRWEKNQYKKKQPKGWFFFLLCLGKIRLYVTAGMPKWTKLSEFFHDLLSATRPYERKVYCTLITDIWKNELQH